MLLLLLLQLRNSAALASLGIQYKDTQQAHRFQHTIRMLHEAIAITLVWCCRARAQRCSTGAEPTGFRMFPLQQEV
jgi:hypothetical protein